jgi:hypothetical protein
MSAAGFAVAELLVSHAVPKVLTVFLFMLALGNLLPAGAVAWLGKVLFAAALVPLSPGDGQAEVTLTLLPAATFLLPLGALHCMVLYSAGLFTFRDYFRYGLRIALVIVPLMMALPFAAEYSRQPPPAQDRGAANRYEQARTPVDICVLPSKRGGAVHIRHGKLPLEPEKAPYTDWDAFDSDGTPPGQHPLKPNGRKE